MSLARVMTQPVTIQRATTSTGRYGDTERSWSSPTETATVAWIAQENRSEVLDGRDAEISRWVGFFPAGTDLLATDRVVRDDQTFEVDGPPNPASTPRGAHHIEANLKIVSG